MGGFSSFSLAGTDVGSVTPPLPEPGAHVVTLRSPRTRSALWQKGQRKLHPGVNTVAAVRPGKSSSVSFCMPESFMLAIVPPSSVEANAHGDPVFSCMLKESGEDSVTSCFHARGNSGLLSVEELRRVCVRGVAAARVGMCETSACRRPFRRRLCDNAGSA